MYHEVMDNTCHTKAVKSLYLVVFHGCFALQLAARIPAGYFVDRCKVQRSCRQAAEKAASIFQSGWIREKIMGGCNSY